MGKLIKAIFSLFFVVVVLAVAAIAVISVVVDPNDHKPLITEKVQQATGRELMLEGDLSLTFFPKVGVSLGKTSLSNAPGFGDKPFFSANEVELRVKLMPALMSLGKDIRVDTIVLDGLELNLAKDKQGTTNWADLAGGSKQKDDGEDSAELEGLGSIEIGGIRFVNANIVWDDRSTGQKAEIRNLKLVSGAIIPGVPVDLEMAFDMDVNQPATNGRFEMTTTLEIDDEGERINLMPLKLQLDAKSDAVPGNRLDASLESNLKINLEDQTAAVSGLKLDVGGMSLTGELNGTRIIEAPAFTGKLNLAQFNLKELLKSLEMEVPQTADPAAMTRISLSMDLAYKTDWASLSNLKASLDDTTLSGTASVANFARPAIRFDLDMDQFDADRYIPPVAEETSTTSESGSQAASGEEADVIPVETLRSLDVDGSFRLGQLKLSNLSMGDAEIKVKGKDGKFAVSQKIGQMYQGSLFSQVDIDARNDLARMRIEKHLKGVQAGPLLKDLTGKETLSGRGQFNMNVTTVGNKVSAIKSALNGNLDLRFEDGAVSGVNVAQLIRNAKAKFEGKPSEEIAEADNKTDFSELSATATIQQGVLVNRDLLAKSPLLRVEGEGEVDIGRDSLDYKLTAVLVGSLEGQGGAELGDLAGVPIPVHAKGPFNNLSYGVNWERLVQETAKTKAKEKVQETIQKKLGDKLGEDLGGKLLKGFGF